MVQTVEDPHPVINSRVDPARRPHVRGVNVSEYRLAAPPVLLRGRATTTLPTSRHRTIGSGKRLLGSAAIPRPIAHADLFLVAQEPSARRSRASCSRCESRPSTSRARRDRARCKVASSAGQRARCPNQRAGLSGCPSSGKRASGRAASGSIDLPDHEAGLQRLPAPCALSRSRPGPPRATARRAGDGPRREPVRSSPTVQ
jgi:hypothetical protein